MKRNILGFLIALPLLLALTPITHARVTMPDDVALWRILVHEASLPVRDETGTWVGRRSRLPWGDDVYIIHEVILRGAARTHTEYTTFAQLYSNRMFEPLTEIERTRLQLGIPLDGNRWAGFMTPDLRRPRAWDGGSWSEHTDAASHALELAREVVQTDLYMLMDFSPCAEPVDDWGGTMDGTRAAGLGLIEIDCGPNAANTGYARPSQIRVRLTVGEWPRADVD